MKNTRKYEYIFIGIIILSCAIMYFTSNYYVDKIKKQGVYVLGTISKKSSVKNGSHYDCVYKYHGSLFKSSFLEAGLRLNEGDLIFVGLLPDKPGINNPLYGTAVPHCLSLNSVPHDGWKELPIDSCK